MIDMIIMITGSVGTGKTSLAEALARRLGFPLIRLSDAISRIPSKYNKKLRTREVDVAELGKWLAKETGGMRDFIVEGHMACELELDADYVFVLRAHPDELGKRLKARKYVKAKVDENVMAEALDYCLLKVEKKKNVFEIDTTGRSAIRSAEEAMRIIEGRKRLFRKVSWSSWLHAATSPRPRAGRGTR
jgi:adenylate kinase